MVGGVFDRLIVVGRLSSDATSDTWLCHDPDSVMDEVKLVRVRAASVRPARSREIDLLRALRDRGVTNGGVGSSGSGRMRALARAAAAAGHVQHYPVPGLIDEFVVDAPPLTAAAAFRSLARSRSGNQLASPGSNESSHSPARGTAAYMSPHSLVTDAPISMLAIAQHQHEEHAKQADQMHACSVLKLHGLSLAELGSHFNAGRVPMSFVRTIARSLLEALGWLHNHAGIACARVTPTTCVTTPSEADQAAVADAARHFVQQLTSRRGARHSGTSFSNVATNGISTGALRIDSAKEAAKKKVLAAAAAAADAAAERTAAKVVTESFKISTAFGVPAPSISVVRNVTGSAAVGNSRSTRPAIGIIGDEHHFVAYGETDHKGLPIDELMDVDEMFRRGQIMLSDLDHAFWRRNVGSGGSGSGNSSFAMNSGMSRRDSGNSLSTTPGGIDSDGSITCAIDDDYDLDDDDPFIPYRSPEMIVGATVGCETDVWSAGCVLFELATGERLFEPAASVQHGYSRDADHLAQVVEHAGPLPRDSATRGYRSRELFDRHGRIRGVADADLKPWPLEKVLTVKYRVKERDAVALSALLRDMLQPDSRRRSSARQCLEDHSNFLSDIGAA
jgi:Protein kinase domain